MHCLTRALACGLLAPKMLFFVRSKSPQFRVLRRIFIAETPPAGENRRMTKNLNTQRQSRPEARATAAQISHSLIEAREAKRRRSIAKIGLATALVAIFCWFGAAVNEASIAGDQDHAVKARWAGLAGTPVSEPLRWDADEELRDTPPWRSLAWAGMDDSSRWGEIQADSDRPGETTAKTPWSVIRQGKPGESVEITVQGLVGEEPADWKTRKNLMDNYVTDYTRAAGARPARVAGDAESISGSAISPQMTTEPIGASGQIKASEKPGETQVVWAWVKAMRVDAQGGREIIVGAGHAPLSLILAQKKQANESSPAWGRAAMFALAALAAAISVVFRWHALQSANPEDATGSNMLADLAGAACGSVFVDLALIAAGKALSWLTPSKKAFE